MLKQIIKRNGNLESFTASKLNKWSQWASKYLGDRVSWSNVVLDAITDTKEIINSEDLQRKLIKACTVKRNWAYNLMGGRLEASLTYKKLYNNDIPTCKELFLKLESLGLMKKLNFLDQEWDYIDNIIDHNRDFNLAHFQIDQVIKKYSIQNRTKKIKYESPQFTFMRMALALSLTEEDSVKLNHIKKYYEFFSSGKINAPSPNYINLGTKLNGYSSCVLYTTNDSSASLAIGDHIAYIMTCMSAGIGNNINIRSIGDPIRNGMISHMGKLPYYKALAGAVGANLQAGRGGACTSYYSCFDPEAEVISLLQNPTSTEDKKNRDIHFAVMMNRLFAKKVAKNEKIFTFNTYTANDLTALFYSGKQDEFEILYNVYENNTSFIKNYVDARKLFILFNTQSYEVGTHYFAMIDEINRHTPHLDTIYSSNLCLEITQPTSPYLNMLDLYSSKDHGNGEVSTCSLAAISVCNIDSDEEYEDATYYALKMIDKCIHISDYPLPHMEVTVKSRLNAGVGMIGLATCLARAGVTYSSKEGKQLIHDLAERHAYFVIKSSLKLGIELGNAPWINKTKWPLGWLPIDTYKKTVDQIIEPVYKYDWEKLRKDIISNGGIRNSSLITHMPTESSSKASGVPNGVYPIRGNSLKKKDGTNVIDWCATDSDLLEGNYDIAWNIPTKDMIECYAIIQKFSDQSISADLYKDRSITLDITDEEMISDFLHMVKYGMKTRYYQNSLTSNQTGDKIETNYESNCASGVCSL